MNTRRYALIAGQGRSGTNWLLEILDLSRHTHCRNEPNECIGSALFELPSGQVLTPDLDAKLERTWDNAVARTSRSFGARDQSITVYKDHYRRAAQQMGLVRVARGKRLRRVLGQVFPGAGREEWPVPAWVVNNRRFGLSLPVHKLNRVPGWMVWVLGQRPEAFVIHIVRHPGGYLNSLAKRLWSQLDRGTVERDNRERLAEIAACDPAWGDRFGDLAALSSVETELWYWRYAAETIHKAGAGNPHYQLIKYEELTRNPLEISRSVYHACGLEWDVAIERGIQQMSAESRAIAAAWRDRLKADQIAAVERVLEDSLMRDWWSESDRGGMEVAAGLPAGGRSAGFATPLGASS